MTEDLEDQLIRVLAERAETVSTAPAYRLVPDAGPRAARADADHRAPRRTNWSWRLSAGAFVAVAAVVAVVLVHTSGEKTAAPPAHRPSCQLANSQRFASALREGLLPPGSVDLAGAVDGSELVGVQRGAATTAVELLDGAGGVHEVWNARPGQRVTAIANPNGAIGTTFVAFALKSLSSPAATVVVAARHGTAMALRGPTPGYVVSADARTAPIARDDNVAVFATSRTRPADDRQFLYYSDNAWRRTFVGRVPHISQVLPVGGNLVLARHRPDGTVELRFTERQYRPSTLEPAAYTGFSFSSDRTTLTWLTDQRSWPSLWHWRPGDPAPRRVALPRSLTPIAANGDYVIERSVRPGAGQAVVDAASGVITYLPVGVALVRVDGSVAVLLQRSSTGVRYSRVPVRALADCAG